MEDQPHCPTRPPSSRSTILSCPPSLALGILACQCMWHEFLSVHLSANWHWSMTDTVQMHVHYKNKSLIQSLVLTCLATTVAWLVSSHVRFYGNKSLPDSCLTLYPTYPCFNKQLTGGGIICSRDFMHRRRKKPGNEATEAATGGWYLYICSRVLQLVVKKGEHFWRLSSTAMWDSTKVLYLSNLEATPTSTFVLKQPRSHTHKHFCT